MLRREETEAFAAFAGAVVAVGDDGLIQFASSGALQVLGWDASLVGRPLTTIIPERLQPEHRTGFDRYVRTGVSRLQGRTVRVPARTQAGPEREVDLTIRVFRRPDGTKLVAAALSVAPLGRAPDDLVVLENSLIHRMYDLI
jgi:PAS domain S-box-containing protein